MGYLMRVYVATFEQVKRSILAAAEPRPGGSLLDLGCGDGALTAEVAARARVGRACAIEIAGERAESARARGIEVVEADLGERFPWPDASFDIVHANQVIEHMPRTDHFLREIRRVLAPDGYAIVCTNNLASWHNIASLLVGAQPTVCHVSDETIAGIAVSEWEGPGNDAHSHQRVFTGRALTRLASHHGLRTELALGVGYYPLPPSLAVPLARIDKRHAAYLLHRLRPEDS